MRYLVPDFLGGGTLGTMIESSPLGNSTRPLRQNPHKEIGNADGNPKAHPETSELQRGW